MAQEKQEALKKGVVERIKKSTSHYEVLGISKNANSDEINNAYMALAQYMPLDKEGESTLFNKISIAYNTLAIQTIREKYDREQAILQAEKNVSFYANILSSATINRDSGDEKAVQAALPKEVKEGLVLLGGQRDLNLKNIKESCTVELQRFIQARGSIDKKTGVITLPRMSISETSKVLTMKKIREAHDLIVQIEKAGSLKEMNTVLHKGFNSEICSSKLGDDLLAVIVKCTVITALPERPSAKLS